MGRAHPAPPSFGTPDAATAAGALERQGLNGQTATFFYWDDMPELPVWVRVEGAEVPENLMADPYSGDYLPHATRLHGFFQGVLRFHRSLMLGELGYWITGLASLALGLLVISGIIYSAPKLRFFWRAWLVSEPRRRPVKWGRWHRTLGWWFAPTLLLAVFTGLFWAFAGYRDAFLWLTRSTAPEPPRFEAAGDAEARASIPQIWETAAPFAVGAPSMRLSIPTRPGVFARFEWQPEESPFTSARSVAWIHPQTAELVRVDHARDRGAGFWVYRAAYPLHTGLILGLPTQALMAASALSIPFFTITGYWLYVRHRRKALAARQPASH